MTTHIQCYRAIFNYLVVPIVSVQSIFLVPWVLKRLVRDWVELYWETGRRGRRRRWDEEDSSLSLVGQSSRNNMVSMATMGHLNKSVMTMGKIFSGRFSTKTRPLWMPTHFLSYTITKAILIYIRLNNCWSTLSNKQ